jgi:hypothetical protein
MFSISQGISVIKIIYWVGVCYAAEVDLFWGPAVLLSDDYLGAFS